MLLTTQPRLLSIAFFSSLFMLSACSNSNSNQNEPSASQETAQATQNSNSTDNNKPNYVVATVKVFKPFVMRDEEFQLSGFDIDTINAIAKDQDFNITFAVVPREELLEGIKSKKYDMAIAGISITPERQQTMQFSEPYFYSQKAVLAKSDKPAINNFSELKPYNVAVIANGTSAKILEGVMDDKSHIQYVETPYSTVEQVVQNKSDYALGDSPVLTYYGNELKDFDLKTYTDSQIPAEPYGVVFAQNRDDGLVQKINTGLKNIKADGTYQEIETKWFGSNQ